MTTTVAKTINAFVRGGDAVTASKVLRAVHLSRCYTYAFRVDTSPPPAGEALPDDVAWSHDPTAGVNQYPEHCGKTSPNPMTGIQYSSPLDYRLRIGHTSERAATVWSSVYTSGAALLYSRGLLIAARQSIGGRDGQVAIMIRSVSGLDTVQRRHVAQLRKELSRIRAASRWRPLARALVITVSDDVLSDHAHGPRWSCTVLRQDGAHEPATVHAFNRDGAWEELRKVCVSRMDDGVLRSTESVALRPTSATVDALAPFVPAEVSA